MHGIDPDERAVPAAPPARGGRRPAVPGRDPHHLLHRNDRPETVRGAGDRDETRLSVDERGEMIEIERAVRTEARLADLEPAVPAPERLPRRDVRRMVDPGHDQVVAAPEQIAQRE